MASLCGTGSSSGVLWRGRESFIHHLSGFLFFFGIIHKHHIHVFCVCSLQCFISQICIMLLIMVLTIPIFNFIIWKRNKIRCTTLTALGLMETLCYGSDCRRITFLMMIWIYISFILVIVNITVCFCLEAFCNTISYAPKVDCSISKSQLKWMSHLPASVHQWLMSPSLRSHASHWHVGVGCWKVINNSYFVFNAQF